MIEAAWMVFGAAAFMGMFALRLARDPSFDRRSAAETALGVALLMGVPLAISAAAYVAVATWASESYARDAKFLAKMAAFLAWLPAQAIGGILLVYFRVSRRILDRIWVSRVEGSGRERSSKTINQTGT